MKNGKPEKTKKWKWKTWTSGKMKRFWFWLWFWLSLWLSLCCPLFFWLLWLWLLWFMFWLLWWWLLFFSTMFERGVCGSGRVQGRTELRKFIMHKCWTRWKSCRDSARGALGALLRRVGVGVGLRLAHQSQDMLQTRGILEKTPWTPKVGLACLWFFTCQK